MEKSFFWATNGVGDGKSEGYGASDMFEAFRMMLLASDSPSIGVSYGYLNDLEVTNLAGTVLQMDTGGALVYGIPYFNTTPITFDTGTPLIDNTGFRVILRAEWATQTVRAALLVNADGVQAAPALTQIAGVTWEISIASGYTTVLGAVLVLVGPGYIVPGCVLDNNHIAPRIRTVFIPCSQATVGGAAIARVGRGWPMADGVQTYCYGETQVPYDHYSTYTCWVLPVFLPSATSALLARLTNSVHFGKPGEIYNIHTSSDVYDWGPHVIDVIDMGIYKSIGATLTEGDIITVVFDRNGAHANDTYTGIIYLKGWLLYYMADM